MIPVLYRSIVSATMFHKNIMNGFKSSGEKTRIQYLSLQRGIIP